MILQSLKELAVRENLMDDPDFEPKPVRWIIHLGADGRFLDVDCTDQGAGKGKTRPLMMYIPRQRVRTSGSSANFLVDKAEYVLGFDPDENPKKTKKLTLHNQLFLEFAESSLVLASEDEGIKAVLGFLRDDDAKRQCVERVRDRALSNDLFCFEYDDEEEPPGTKVHERGAIRQAWRTMRHTTSDSGEPRATCLVCGAARRTADVHPQIKRVPGGSTSGIALISFNAPAFFSLAFDGADNASICQACAEAYTTALNRLFHPEYPKPGGDVGEVLPRRSFRLSDDTAVVYWASAESLLVNRFGDLEYADESKADALFRSVHKGGEAPLDDPTAFHALIVTGGQGRATLRGYHRSTVGELAESIRLYFQDVDIVPRFAKAPKRVALRWLIRSLAAGGKDENVDPGLAGQLFWAVINGGLFPPAVLHAALRRIRHEPEDPDRSKYKHTRERMALIRATLNRRFRADDPIVRSLITREVALMLDEKCRNNAYCLGRLFSVLEKLQGEAIGNPNATITDRFYGAASATPVAVFGTLMRKAQHHLAKMDGPLYQRKIQEILSMLAPANAFPKILSLEQQALFALGYYHQRADLWASKKQESPESSNAVEVEAAA